MNNTGRTQVERTYNALILEPNGESRMRLKQVLRLMKRFDWITTLNRPDSRQNVAELLQEIDVVFISHRFSPDAVSEFVQQGKKLPRGKEIAYVLLQSKGLSASEVTLQYLYGADGVLLDPYSVESVEEIVNLAEQIKQGEQDRRFEMAMRLLIKELRAQVTHLAEVVKTGRPARVSRVVLKDMCNVLREFDEEKLAMYFDLLCEVMPDVPPPAECDDTYRGSSARIRKVVVTHTVSEVRDLLAA